MRIWLARAATSLYVIVALRTFWRPRPVRHRWPAHDVEQMQRLYAGAYRQTIRSALGKPDDRL